MSNFTIDFFELAFLAEAYIPPNPIARTMFWQRLTNVYWEQMSDEERDRLFEWLNRNDNYKQSLEKEEETQIFHARFDPDNQYIVYTTMDGKDDVNRVFKYKDLYYVRSNSWITPEFITKVEKL
jgi:hypothetical protein